MDNDKIIDSMVEESKNEVSMPERKEMDFDANKKPMQPKPSINPEKLKTMNTATDIEKEVFKTPISRENAKSIAKPVYTPFKLDSKKYSDVQKTPYGFIYNIGNQSITDLAEQERAFGNKVDPNKKYGFSRTTDSGDEVVHETFEDAYNAAKGKSQEKSEEKQSNWYDNLTDEDEHAKAYKDKALAVDPERATLIAKAMDEYVGEKPQRSFITEDQLKRYGEKLGLPSMSDRDLRLMWDDVYNVGSYKGYGTPYDKGGRELEDARSAFAEVVNQEARNRKAKGNYFPYNEEDIDKAKNKILDIIKPHEGYDLDSPEAYMTRNELSQIEDIADKYHISDEELKNLHPVLNPEKMGYKVKGWIDSNKIKKEKEDKELLDNADLDRSKSEKKPKEISPQADEQLKRVASGLGKEYKELRAYFDEFKDMLKLPDDKIVDIIADDYVRRYMKSIMEDYTYGEDKESVKDEQYGSTFEILSELDVGQSVDKDGGKLTLVKKEPGRLTFKDEKGQISYITNAKLPKIK